MGLRTKTRLAPETAKDRLRSLDAGVVLSSRWRSFRRKVLLVASVVGFAFFLGVPHLRLNYVEQNGHVVSGVYWSVTGKRTLHAGQVAPTCPLIALVPLSLLRQEQ